MRTNRSSIIFTLLLHSALLIGLLCIEKYVSLAVTSYSTENVLKATIIYIYVVLLFLIFYKIEDEVLGRRLRCRFFHKDFYVTDFLSFFFMSLIILSYALIAIDSKFVDSLMFEGYSKDHFTGGEYNTFYCALLGSTVSILNSRRSKTKEAKKLKQVGQVIVGTISAFVCLIVLILIICRACGIYDFY